MVFATEFDPREQSQRRSRLQTQARSHSDLQTSTVSLQEISALEHRIQAVPALKSSNHNVAPLQVGGPAKRVRLDANSTLSLPQQPKLPLGLRVLTRLQQGSTAITGVLVTAALVIYGSTVYVDKSTNKAILQLDALQGESQQLTSTNESIKQSLAEQATRPDSGLEPYEAGDVIFVDPAPPREKLTPDLADDPDSAAAETEMPGPLGY